MSGPTPPYSNPPINPQYYQPSVFDISNITRGKTTVVSMSDNTTGGSTVTPNYTIGQQVKLLIPFTFGMRQINNQVGYVISLPTSSSVEIDIDSRFYNAYTSSPTYGPTHAQIIAIGDVNSGEVNTQGRVNNITYIQGSFINISPN